MNGRFSRRTRRRLPPPSDEPSSPRKDWREVLTAVVASRSRSRCWWCRRSGRRSTRRHRPGGDSSAGSCQAPRSSCRSGSRTRSNPSGCRTGTPGSSRAARSKGDREERDEDEGLPFHEVISFLVGGASVGQSRGGRSARWRKLAESTQQGVRRPSKRALQPLRAARAGGG